MMVFDLEWMNLCDEPSPAQQEKEKRRARIGPVGVVPKTCGDPCDSEGKASKDECVGLMSQNGFSLQICTHYYTLFFKKCVSTSLIADVTRKCAELQQQGPLPNRTIQGCPFCLESINTTGELCETAVGTSC
ncbi:hypothetical protein Q9966_000765 [Columba livia]|nr:hypothetical protein Q9966_000765 [Columba livia]